MLATTWSCHERTYHWIAGPHAVVVEERVDAFTLVGIAEVPRLDAIAQHWVHVDYARAAADGEERRRAVQDRA